MLVAKKEDQASGTMKLFDVYPLFDIEPVKASGAYVYDKNGTEYLDLYGGHAVISIGHTHPEYVAALSGQLQKIAFYSNSVKIPLQEELGAKLGNASGYDDYRLFLCNSGAEANENALKLASFKNGRKKIIAFDKAFHGRTSLAVACTDDVSIQAPVNQNDNVVFLRLNDEDELEKAFNENICAVIVEGIQGVGGIRVASPSFLRKIRSLCDKFGAYMILDEIQSGYGRSGRFFAHQYADVKPDLITTAKGMGNGFPIGAVLISPAFESKHGLLGTTFGGNYLACVAGITVLDVIKKEQLVKNAETIGNYILKTVKGFNHVEEVRGMGLMIGIELPQPCAAVRNDLLYTHKIFTGSSSNKNTLRLLPPLCIGMKEADRFLEGLQTSLKKYFG